MGNKTQISGCTLEYYDQILSSLRNTHKFPFKECRSCYLSVVYNNKLTFQKLKIVAKKAIKRPGFPFTHKSFSVIFISARGHDATLMIIFIISSLFILSVVKLTLTEIDQ